jgi:lincosamide and streptogramin A transport system ATP-binding/permease protein
LDRCVDHILSINKTTIEIQKGNFSTWWQNKTLQDQYELSANARLKRDIDRLSAAAARTSGWSDAVELTKFGTRNSGLRPDRGFVGHKAAKMMKRAKHIEQRRQQNIEAKSKLLKNIESNEPLKLVEAKAEMHQLIKLSNICIQYGERTICSDVSFTVNRGDRIAVIGKNGSGKSSLLKLINREAIAHSGMLTESAQLVISYVSQDTSSLRGTLKDYAASRDIPEHLLKAMLSKLGIGQQQFDKPIENFSGGQKKKLLIAGSLCQRAHLYIWDEPLNFIDVISRMQIEALLLEAQPTIVFVEHDRAFCEAVATQKVTL